jgi:DNA-binding response OmpR family regulator
MDRLRDACAVDGVKNEQLMIMKWQFTPVTQHSDNAMHKTRWFIHLIRRMILIGQESKFHKSFGIHRIRKCGEDTGAGTVTRNDILVHLHPMEFKLLQFFMRHPNQVFSAHALFERVWQKDFGLEEDTVRTHIRTLRRKIDSAGCQSVITTVRGLGYKTENQ